MKDPRSIAAIRCRFSAFGRARPHSGGVPTAAQSTRGGDANSSCGIDGYAYTDADRHPHAIAGADTHGHAGAAGPA